MGEARGDEAVLDLSSWPQQPPRPVQQRRPTLPPRPVRRRPLPTAALARFGGAALGLGVLLLAVPLPGTGCPSPVGVWASDPRPLPAATPPGLDDAAVKADQAAVDAAGRALAGHDAQVAAARRLLAAPATGRTTARPAPPASADVTALERAVRDDTAARDQAGAVLDRLVEQQQAADDPSAYDADVAAAQEDLDVAQARLADDQQALAAARRARPAPAPTPVVSADRTQALAVVAGDATLRPGLVGRLRTAKQVQAQHLAARRAALATWSTRHARDVAAVKRANTRLAACGGTAGSSGAAGGAAGLAGVGLLALRRRTA